MQITKMKGLANSEDPKDACMMPYTTTRLGLYCICRKKGAKRRYTCSCLTKEYRLRIFGFIVTCHMYRAVGIGGGGGTGEPCPPIICKKVRDFIVQILYCSLQRSVILKKNMCAPQSVCAPPQSVIASYGPDVLYNLKAMHTLYSMILYMQGRYKYFKCICYFKGRLLRIHLPGPYFVSTESEQMYSSRYEDIGFQSGYITFQGKTNRQGLLTTGCHQTFWSGDNRLSLTKCLVTTGCH